MDIQENIPLGNKTTMRIGGSALFYADISTKEDAQEAFVFAKEKELPLITFGGGSNTIFADETINALVVRIKADESKIDGNQITVEAGKNLPMLINELAEQGLDLSPFTGIPGTVGGAIFGNAGQGPKGVWIDSFVESVTVLMEGEWKTLTKDECLFSYRESGFKDMNSPIIWEVLLNVPSKPKEEIQKTISELLNKRTETQPHVKTSGSCFKATDDTPAWKLIEKAGLRGMKIGAIEVSDKHANFLINTGEGTFEDVSQAIEKIKEVVPDISGVEMRLYGKDGKMVTG